MKRGGIFMAGQETYLPVALDKPEQLVVWAIEFRRQIEDSVRVGKRKSICRGGSLLVKRR